MGTSHKWLKSLRRKFHRSSNKGVVFSSNEELIIVEEPEEDQEEEEEEEDRGGANSSSISSLLPCLTKEDVAAIKIQATFRAHLARRAYRALRSLVKLQALARGAYVRKQAQLALHCMHALVRLQVRVRARQLLGSFDL